MNLIDKNTKVYYISTFLLFLASTMPHSILTVLFLKKGLLMSQIVLMQSFFNLSMIIFEIPSGVMSDLYSRKKVYILSLLTLIITFFLIIFSKSLFWLSVAYTMKLYLLLILIFLMAITVIILKNNLIFTGIYLILCTIFFIINYYFEFNFNKILSKEKISAITSMKSFFSRIFSFGTLFVSSLLLRKISVVNLFVINVTVVIFVVMYLIFRINKSVRQPWIKNNIGV